MSATTPNLTAGEVMDRAAVLMNDPGRTDYNYATLVPHLNMALDELKSNLADNQSGISIGNSLPLFVPKGTAAIWPPDYPFQPPTVLKYNVDVTDIQEIVERRPGGNENEWTLMKRLEYHPLHEPMDILADWAWEQRAIKFNFGGCKSDREIRLKYVIFEERMTAVDETTIIGHADLRPYLAFKTAAFAAMFIGENAERAQVLNAQADEALDRILSIQNKGRQNIMTRHRPFRAAYKMRGGW
jgi:hypothetical protein